MTITNKWKNSVFALSLGVLTVGIATACSSNTGDDFPDNPVEAVFSARISIPTPTRATGTNWENDDEVGIFMLRDGGSLSVSDQIIANNYRYKVVSPGGPVADAGDYLKHVSTTDGGKGAIYFNPGDAYDFVAYYPYKDESLLIDYKYPISLADQYNAFTTANHDLLYSTSRRRNVKSDNVSFVFNHVLSNITINVERGRGIDVDGFKAKNAVITGMPTTAKFDLKDVTGKTITEMANVANIESKKSDEDGKLYEVIILPQSAAAYSGRTIRFTVSGTLYQWAIPDGFAFEQGKRYTYTFNLTTSGLEMDGDVIISDWTDGGVLDPSEWGNGIQEFPVETVRIPSGSFLMGSTVTGTTTGELITHTVHISGFRMSKYEITNADYCDFLNDNLDVITSTTTNVTATLTGTDEHGYTYNYAGVVLAESNAESIRFVDGAWEPYAGRENYPANRITWYGAFAYAKWAGGRLPTEAEWEYASKAGSTQLTEANNYGIGVTSTTDPTPVQITSTNLGSYAWFTSNNTPATGDNFAAGPKPVGLKLPNAWGLYDMHGNVWEWCYDWYSATYYTADTATDPANTIVATYRVLRGGYYISAATHCRSAYRNYYTPATVGTYYGFRVVFSL